MALFSSSVSLLVTHTLSVHSFAGHDADVGAAAVATLHTSLTGVVAALSRAVEDISTSITNMNKQTAAGTARCAADAEGMLAALAKTSGPLLQTYRAWSRTYVKCLDEKAEEADTASKQLAAVSALSDTHSMHAAATLHDVDHLSILDTSVVGDGAVLHNPVCTVASAALAGISTLWCDLPDTTMSTLTGRGLHIFVKGPAGVQRNVLIVKPRVSNGLLAAYVQPDDVRLLLKDDDGAFIDAHVTVDPVADGGFQLAFAVAAECKSKLNVLLSVCGVAIGPVITVHSGFNAKKDSTLVATHAVDGGWRSSIAVNCDKSVMAVSVAIHITCPGYDSEGRSEIHFYHLTPAFAFSHTIGKHGMEPTEFYFPSKLCFTDDGDILVVDDLHRVQHWTVAGKYINALLSDGMHCQTAIATQGDMVAVGFEFWPTHLFSLATGELIREFRKIHNNGDGIGDLQFSPDGQYLLAAAYNNRCIVLYTTGDGKLLKKIGKCVIGGDASNNVAFGADGEIIASDGANKRMCVFSADGDTLLRSWSKLENTCASPKEPFSRTFITSGANMFVLNCFGNTVRVFE